jgi:PAS domain-containing protein
MLGVVFGRGRGSVDRVNLRSLSFVKLTDIVWGSCLILTERLLKELALIDPEFQNLLIHAIIDHSPNGILVVDDKNNIVSHNRQFIDIWEIDKALLQGTEPGTAIGMNHEITLKNVLPRMKNPQEILANNCSQTRM